MTKTNTEVINNVSSPNYFNKIKNFLNSYWALGVLSLIIIVCWTLSVPAVSVSLLVVFEILVLIFCRDNPKAFLFPILAIYCAPREELNTSTLIAGIVLFSILIIAMVSFVIYKVKVEKVKCSKGKLFWPFLLLIPANFLAGVVGHFNILISVAVLALLFLIYSGYWICLNFVKNAQKYFAWCAIFISVIISVQIFIQYLMLGDFFAQIINKVIWIGFYNINAESVVMLTGLCACFYLAMQRKNNIWLALLGLFLDFMIFQNYSRMTTVLAAIISLVYFVLLIHKSKHKKEIFISLGVVVAVGLIICGIFWNKVYEVIDYYIDLGASLNGRSELWSWCFKEFTKNWHFGAGFTTTDPYALGGGAPGIVDSGGYGFILPHNLVLYHLTCTGIIGTLLSIPLYVYRYKVMVKKFTTFNIFAFISYTSILLVSMFDPTYPNDFFLVLFFMALFATAENISYNNEQDEIDENNALLENKNNAELNKTALAEVNTLNKDSSNKVKNNLENDTMINKDNKIKQNSTIKNNKQKNIKENKIEKDNLNQNNKTSITKNNK